MRSENEDPMATYRTTPAPPIGHVPGLDKLAVAVCQQGGHIPNRDRSLPGSCDFHRRMAWAYVRIIDASLAPVAAVSAPPKEDQK